MSESQPIFFQADGEIRELDVQVTVNPQLDDDDPYSERRDWQENVSSQMQRAQQMIRDYTEFALNSFSSVASAQIEEITLNFGIKIGGSAGVPYITEGKAESNLNVVVKCKFP